MYDLSGFTIVEARLYHLTITDCQNPNNTARFDIEINPFAAGIDFEANRIRLRTRIKIISIQKESIAEHEIVCESDAEVIYSYQVDKINFIETEGSLTIHPDLYLHLVAISYSTIRGLLSASTKGTLFHKAYLPILNPTQLVQTKQSLSLNL